MSEQFAKKEDKKEVLKSAIKRLHDGEDPEKVKKECKNALKGLQPHDIGLIEQELIDEGMSREEVRKLCDVHLALFRESIETSGPEVPDWHPVYILMEEHNMMLGFADKLRSIVNTLKKSDGFDSARESMEELNHIVHNLKDSENHNLREENVLFPFLDKHDITGPPAVMWKEHDMIRGIKKEVYKVVDNKENLGFESFSRELGESSIKLSEALSNHFYKENNVLFPMALNAIHQPEWKEIRMEFDELGYCCFTPEPAAIMIGEKKEEKAVEKMEGVITFEIGSLTKDALEAMLNTLPVDLTFVDKNDTVQYFSQGKERIFVRTKAVIGMKVQQCHPQKSVHVVNQILDDFKTGKRDNADFWINMKGRTIYIRYFPVRNGSGQYLGCLEVTQDVTDIKELEGEKRLLD